ncbi:MAG: hypothetical protein LLF76_02735 [Planctomycetaceae bacterium]|nr:hypothetical protein [Planctomycetaceae bacterium]
MHAVPIEIAQRGSPLQSIEIADFSGGMVTSMPQNGLSDKYFAAIYNMELEINGLLRVRNGFRPFDASNGESVLPGVPVSICLEDRSGTVTALAHLASGSVQAWNSLLASWSEIKTGYDADDKGAEFLKYTVNAAEDILFYNGTDAPQRWSGEAASADMGLSNVFTLPTVTDTAAIGRGLQITSGGPMLCYKYTAFYDDSGTTTKYGESACNSLTKEITASTAGLRKFTHTIATLPTGVSKLNVYRAPLNVPQGPYRYVGSLTATTPLEDIMPFGQEGVELTVFDGAMPVLKHAAVAGGRIVAIDGDIPSKVIWSQPGMPDVFPELNYAYLPEDGTGVAVFNGNVFVFTRNTVYMLDGSNFEAANFIKMCDKGCVSHKTIQDVGSGLVWLGIDNVYWADFNTRGADGDFPMPIGEPIKDQILEIRPSKASKAASAFVGNKYYLIFPGLSQDECTTTLCLNTIRGLALLPMGGGWTSQGWMASDLAVKDGVLYSMDRETKYIYTHAYPDDILSYADYTGNARTPIPVSIETGWVTMGAEWFHKLVHSVSVAAETSQTELVVEVVARDKQSNELRGTIPITLGSTLAAMDENVLVWDIGEWAPDEGDLGLQWAVDTRRIHASHKRFKKGLKGLWCKLIIRSSDAQDMRLLYVKPYFRVIPQAR